MTSLLKTLEKHTFHAFAALGLEANYGKLIFSQRPDLGQFQCNGALRVGKGGGLSPKDVAEKIIEILIQHECFTNLSVAEPGFINLSITDSFLNEYLKNLYIDPRLGVPQNEPAHKVLIDFGGPNIAKAMHVGHIRSTIIGDSLQRLMRFMGDDVVSDVHLGDWGLPMGMIISEVVRRYGTIENLSSLTISLSELEEIYPFAANRCKEDLAAREEARLITAALQQGHPEYRALWEKFREVSLRGIQEVFASLGVSFDLWYGESSVNDIIPPLVKSLIDRNIAQSSEGALIIMVDEEADKAPLPPLMVLNSDQGLTYGITDLATLMQRTGEMAVDTVLYVVDKRQHLHFEQVFRATRKSGLDKGASLEHIGFGTLNGPDNKPFKTRSGGVMRLEVLVDLVKESALNHLEEAGLGKGYSETEQQDIADKVALATLKFADLSNPRLSDYIFDVQKVSSFKGRTGPYLLYTAVRIKSILRKAVDQGLLQGTLLPPTDLERDLMLTLSKLPTALENAYTERAPHHMCDFAYELAQAFSRFYQSCSILKESDKEKAASWLSVVGLTLKQLELVLSLMGINIPERM